MCDTAGLVGTVSGNLRQIVLIGQQVVVALLNRLQASDDRFTNRNLKVTVALALELSLDVGNALA